MKILCAEDHRVNAELVRDLCELAGHEIEVCPDAAGFRAAVARGIHFDVVILDIGLPDGDGAEVLSELRGSGALADVPAVAVTAHVLPAALRRLRAAGFAAVLAKPIDTRTFVADVERVAREGVSWHGS